MTHPEHTSWNDLKARRPVDPDQAAEADQDLRIGQVVYDLRTAAGLTQTALARLAGTTQSAIARIESGGGARKLDTLAKIAAALGRGMVVSFPTAAGDDEDASITVLKAAG
jgi:transcriptional regulator with XRE-family HTH domain